MLVESRIITSKLVLGWEEEEAPGSLQSAHMGNQ